MALARRRPLVVLAIVLAVLLLIVAVIYWAEPAKSLPSFFPGHEANSTHHHFKHGLGAAILAAACLVFAWFQTGPAGRSSATTTS
jgi:hypothetical protein